MPTRIEVRVNSTANTKRIRLQVATCRCVVVSMAVVAEGGFFVVILIGKADVYAADAILCHCAVKGAVSRALD